MVPERDNADALIGAFIQGDGIDSVNLDVSQDEGESVGHFGGASDYDGAKAMLKGKKSSFLWTLWANST